MQTSPEKQTFSEKVEAFLADQKYFLLVFMGILLFLKTPLLVIVFVFIFNFLMWCTDRDEKSNWMSRIGIGLILLWELFLCSGALFLGLKLDFNFVLNVYVFVYCCLWLNNEFKKPLEK